MQYNLQLINTFEDLLFEYNLNNKPKLNTKLKGNLLELITCIIYKCLMYNDIDYTFKELYNLPIYDEGIDCIDIINNILYQVKFYSKNHYCNNKELGTFINFAYELSDKFKSYIIGSEDMKFNKYLTSKIKQEYILDKTIKEIIFNSYKEYFNELNINNINYEDKLNLLQEQINNNIECIINNKEITDNNIKNIKNEIILLINNKNNKNTKINKLWKHQKEVLNIMNNNNNNKNEYYFELSCGSGKTDIFLNFIINNQNKKHLILVPTILLAEQIYNKLYKEYKYLNVNKCWTNNKKIKDNNNIYICVYNSYKLLENIEFDYIYIDEAHHILKKYNENNEDENNEELEIIEENKEDENINSALNSINNKYIYNNITKSKAIKYYFSATLPNIELDYKYSIDEAIKDNIILNFNCCIHKIPTLDNKNIIYTLKIHPEYERILCYCNSINKIKELTKLFNNYGLSSDYLDGNMTLKKRLNIINKLTNGNIRVLFSVNTLSEGIDIPNADTCLFLDDRNSLIQVVQCLGRIMRKSNNKKEGKLLFFTDDFNNCNYIKYINKINNYCNMFMDIKMNRSKIYKHFKIYNEENYEIENNNIEKLELEEINIETLIIKNVIDKIKLNDEEKIKLCQEFYNEFKRLPIKNEIYKNFNISAFIKSIKSGCYKQLKKIIEDIFKCNIIFKKNMSNEEKIKLCKEFYKEYKRLPTYKEIYKNWNIGLFISYLGKYKNNSIKKTIEEIFNTKINKKREVKIINNKDKIKLCKEYYDEFHKLPLYNEKYKDFYIGHFICNLRKGEYEEIKEDIEKIFNIKINHQSYTIEEKINFCKDFYNEFHRLPQSKEIYKNFKIGIFIAHLKITKNIEIKNKIENIFNEKIENKVKINKITDERKILLCKEYYNKFNKLPKYDEKIEDFKIGVFINQLKNKKYNMHLKEDVEKIFNTKF